MLPLHYPRTGGDPTGRSTWRIGRVKISALQRLDACRSTSGPGSRPSRGPQSPRTQKPPASAPGVSHSPLGSPDESRADAGGASGARRRRCGPAACPGPAKPRNLIGCPSRCAPGRRSTHGEEEPASHAIRSGARCTSGTRTSARPSRRSCASRWTTRRRAGTRRWRCRKLPRNSSPSRLKSRCEVTGRSRGYMRKFGLSRITFREMASQGLLPGIRKSSW